MYFATLLPCVPPQEMVKWFYLDIVFRVKSNFLHIKNYSDLHPSQGRMKFATQISLYLIIIVIIIIILNSIKCSWERKASRVK